MDDFMKREYVFTKHGITKEEMEFIVEHNRWVCSWKGDHISDYTPYRRINCPDCRLKDPIGGETSIVLRGKGEREINGS